MEIGDYANYVSFLDDEIVKNSVLQLVKENKEEWRFRIDSSDNYHLTVSKKCGFDHIWYSGENGTLKRRTIIEPF